MASAIWADGVAVAPRENPDQFAQHRESEGDDFGFCQFCFGEIFLLFVVLDEDARTRTLVSGVIFIADQPTPFLRSH